VVQALLGCSHRFRHSQGCLWPLGWTQLPVCHAASMGKLHRQRCLWRQPYGTLQMRKKVHECSVHNRCQRAMLLWWANCTGRDAFDGNLTVHCRCGSRDTSAVCITDASVPCCFDGQIAQAEMPLTATLRYTAEAEAGTRVQCAKQMPACHAALMGKLHRQRCLWRQPYGILQMRKQGHECSVQNRCQPAVMFWWEICTGWDAFDGNLTVHCREDEDEMRSEQKFGVMLHSMAHMHICLWWPHHGTMQGECGWDQVRASIMLLSLAELPLVASFQYIAGESDRRKVRASIILLSLAESPLVASFQYIAGESEWNQVRASIILLSLAESPLVDSSWYIAGTETRSG